MRTQLLRAAPEPHPRAARPARTPPSTVPRDKAAATDCTVPGIHAATRNTDYSQPELLVCLSLQRSLIRITSILPHAEARQGVHKPSSSAASPSHCHCAAPVPSPRTRRWLCPVCPAESGLGQSSPAQLACACRAACPSLPAPAGYTQGHVAVCRGHAPPAPGQGDRVHPQPQGQTLLSPHCTTDGTGTQKHSLGHTTRTSCGAEAGLR